MASRTSTPSPKPVELPLDEALLRRQPLLLELLLEQRHLAPALRSTSHADQRVDARDEDLRLVAIALSHQELLVDGEDARARAERLSRRDADRTHPELGGQ